MLHTVCATISASAFHFNRIDLTENFQAFWDHSSKCCLLSPFKNVVKSIWCFFRLKISLTLSLRDVVTINKFRIFVKVQRRGTDGATTTTYFCVETEHLELSNCRHNWLQFWVSSATFVKVCSCYLLVGGLRLLLLGNHRSSVEMKCMRRCSAHSYSHPKELLSRGSWNNLKLLLRCATDRTHKDRNVFQSRACNKFNWTISRIRNDVIKLLDDLSWPQCIPGKGTSRRYSS
jgi:hypothetical protein